MKDAITQRVLMVAHHIVETQSTLRATARKFGVSKSTVHIDVSKRLNFISPALFQKVKNICDEHFAIKHLLGGKATQIKSKQKNASHKKYKLNK